MEPRAIIILYTGDSTTVGEQTSIIRFLHENNKISAGTEPKVYELNSEDLAKLTIKQVCEKKNSTIKDAVSTAYNYIVCNNAEHIANKDWFAFCMELQVQMQNHKQMRDSVDLLVSTPNVTQYGIDKRVFQNIKSVHQFYVQRFGNL